MREAARSAALRHMALVYLPMSRRPSSGRHSPATFSRFATEGVLAVFGAPWRAATPGATFLAIRPKLARRPLPGPAHVRNPRLLRAARLPRLRHQRRRRLARRRRPLGLQVRGRAD